MRFCDDDILSYLPSFPYPEKVLRHEDLQGAPLLILANKQVLLVLNDNPKSLNPGYI